MARTERVSASVTGVARGRLQVLKVVELEGLGRNGVQTVAVQPQHQQGVGQIFKAVRVQRGDAVVVHVPEQNVKVKVFLASLARFPLKRSRKVDARNRTSFPARLRYDVTSTRSEFKTQSKMLLCYWRALKIINK